LIKIIDDTLVAPIQLRAFLLLKFEITLSGLLFRVVSASSRSSILQAIL
jgi:hypothetical protein